MSSFTSYAKLLETLFAFHEQLVQFRLALVTKIILHHSHCTSCKRLCYQMMNPPDHGEDYDKKPMFGLKLSHKIIKSYQSFFRSLLHILWTHGWIMLSTPKNMHRLKKKIHIAPHCPPTQKQPHSPETDLTQASDQIQLQLPTKISRLHCYATQHVLYASGARYPSTWGLLFSAGHARTAYLRRLSRDGANPSCKSPVQ